MQGVKLIRLIVKISKQADKSDYNQFTFAQKLPLWLCELELDFARLEKENLDLAKENMELAKESAALKRRIAEQERFHLVEKAN